MNRFIGPILALLLCVMICASSAFAGPAVQRPVKVTQPDGTVLQVQIKGDEYQNWTELYPTGQTIVRNPQTKAWEYAVSQPDGTLAPSGVRAEPGGRNAPPSVPKGLKPPRNEELEQKSPDLAAGEEALRGSAATVSGSRKVLVILVNFSDRKLITSATGWNGKIFNTSSGVKSMANFWKDASSGAVTVSPAAHTQPGNPAGIITTTVSDPHPNYGGSISYDSDVMVANHALAQAASFIDFASFDTNGDGVLDPAEVAIYFIYAGFEAAGTGQTPSVWAHAWWGGTITAGTKTVHYWALNGELNDATVQHPVGVLVHELGHSLFGLIDLYDTSGYNQGLGNFSVMAAGSWGADTGEDLGTTPTNLDAWSRQYHGWVTPVEPAAGALNIPATMSATTSIYKLINRGSTSEYFLVDNRQPVGWDQGLRIYLGSGWLGGLLVLHVDDAIASNRYTDAPHQKVVPVQANTALCDMLGEYAGCRGHATTLFYQGNNDSWTASSSPNTNFYDDVPSGFGLTAISAPKPVMTAFFSADTIPPVITAFTIPASYTSFTVPITSFNATDNVGVTGYLVSESSLRPTGTEAEWKPVKPSSYSFTSAGLKTLYAWARDASGNISAAVSGSVNVTGNDVSAPVVTGFAIPATAASLTVPITTFTVTDDFGVTGYLVNESSTKPAASDAAWIAAKPTSYTFQTTGSKTLYAWAKDGAGNVSNSRCATVAVTSTLPSPWQTRDVGSVGVAGSASFQNGAFIVKGSGRDIWGSSDAFRFVYQQITGNAQIIARVASLQNTNPYAKGGVMIRDSLAANAMHATVDITPGIGAEFLRRTSTGVFTSATVRAGLAAPYWVKLVRNGTTFTASVSSDGVTWTQLGSSTISMASTVYIGLVVSSHYNAVLCSATFEAVSAGPLVPDVTAPTVTAFTIPASSSSLTVPITTLTASDNFGVTGYLVGEGSTKPSATDSRWSTTVPGSYTFASAGTKTLYAWAKDAAGNVSASRSATVTVSGGTLPSPWLTRDIGSVGVTGSATYTNGVFTLKGSGANIYGSADAFRYVYQSLTGDGEIVARVTYLQNTNGYAKGGVMFRESLVANSAYAMMNLTPGYGGEFGYRYSTGAGTTSSIPRSGIAAPYWVKLTRVGSTFTGSVSSDGVTWQQVGTSTLSMAATVYVGLIDNSHNNSVLCTTTMDHVTVSAAVDTIPPTITAFSIPASSTSLTVPVSLAATDNVGVTGYILTETSDKPDAQGWSPAPPASYTFQTPGSKILYAWARDGASNISPSRSATTTVSGLPAPWQKQDIGSVGIAGSASYANGIFTLSGSGANIWGNVDAFYFVYKALTGDGEITAWVDSLPCANTWAKGGVMMRQSLAADSVHAMMDVTPSAGAEFSRRFTTGGSTTVSSTAGVKAPYGVRLVRRGTTFTGYISSDNVHWVQVGSSTIGMTGSIYAGFIVNSHNNSALCTTRLSGQ